jgi:hypothetical protein
VRATAAGEEGALVPATASRAGAGRDDGALVLAIGGVPVLSIWELATGARREIALETTPTHLVVRPSDGLVILGGTEIASVDLASREVRRLGLRSSRSRRTARGSRPRST